MLFDRIVIVDWSARNAPAAGADSIWIAVAEHGRVGLSNPATRHAALAEIAAAAANGRTLIGVDFSLGFPAGTAASLGLVGAAWRSMWELLGAEVRDDDHNSNNRFAVASMLNCRIGHDGPGPFWGCPPSARTDSLTSTKPPVAPGWPPEWRRVEARLKQSGLHPFSAWQLLGAGAVGSQSLVGIAALERLRWNLGERLRVWPFDTGLMTPDALPGDAVVVAEIWPSLWPVGVPVGMVKDAAQVESTARRLVTMDGLGTLAALFEPEVATPDRDAIVGEEGWVLGVC